jgi:hypothetical protein
VVLAPHGRYGKGAAKAAATSPQRAKPSQTQAANGASDEKQRGHEGGDGETAPGAARGATSGAAANGGAAAASDSGSELREEVREEDDPMQVELESSLAKLPEVDQRKLRAALGRGRYRGKNAGGGEAEEDDTRRGERERSPRPTKGGEDKEV